MLVCSDVRMCVSLPLLLLSSLRRIGGLEMIPTVTAATEMTAERERERETSKERRRKSEGRAGRGDLPRARLPRTTSHPRYRDYYLIDTARSRQAQGQTLIITRFHPAALPLSLFPYFRRCVLRTSERRRQDLWLVLARPALGKGLLVG